jgi:hypothetical protein
MSGWNHHYIPQFLLRNFGTSNGKSWYVWAHRRDRPEAFRVNTSGIGVQAGFYADGEDLSIDDQITERETEYGNALALLRSRDTDVDALDLHIYRRFMAHGLLRTARARAALSFGIAKAHESAKEAMNDTDMWGAALTNALMDDSFVLDQLNSMMRKQGLPKMPDFVLRGILWPHRAKLLANMPMLIQEFLSKNKAAMEAALSAKSDWGKYAHLRALKRAGVEPEERTRRILGREMGLVRLPKDSLVLGDAMLFGVVRISPFLACDALGPDSEMVGIIQPLAHDIFAYSGGSELAEIAPELINSGSVGTSEEFFVARAASDDSRALMSQFGAVPHFMEKFDWQGLWQELRAEAIAGAIHRNK